MDENEIEGKYALIVKKYQDKIEGLSNVISNLEELEKTLNDKITNHEINRIDYQKQQVLLIEILKDIELKKSIQSDITREMNDLVVKKERLNQECTGLEISVNKKKEYIFDIESFPPKIDELQKEMEGFLDQHTINKRNAEQDLKNIKDELLKLYKSIGSIIG